MPYSLPILLVASALLATACSTPPPTVAPPSPLGALPAADDCTTADGCLESAKVALRSLDFEAAGTRFDKACNMGSVDGCEALAAMALDGSGIPADAARAAGALEKACAKQSQDSCALLGLLLLKGHGVAKDEARAIDLYRGACDAGQVGACANMAVHFHAAGQIADAIPFYDKACKLGVGPACHNLGMLRQSEKTDLPEAARLFAQACELGEMAGCRSHGGMLIDGSAGKTDVKVGKDLLRRACFASDAVACTWLGRHIMGETPAEGHALMKRGCDGGHATGCFYAGATFERGDGTAPDPAAAVRAYNVACKAGIQKACVGKERICKGSAGTQGCKP